MIEISKVYFTNFQVKPGFGLLDKLKNLLIKSEFEKSFESGKMAALKIHFGEYGNLAYIRPNYIRVIVDFIKKGGGIPFITDANTLYKGSRSNAPDHIKTAILNGFGYEITDAPIIIADGLRGTDEIKIPINTKNVKQAKIGTAIALADSVISISHFKGHEQTGFGGALKNLGMGSASKAGKLEQHSTSKPKVNIVNCVKCSLCEKNCPQNAISIKDYAVIDYNLCVGCGQCIAMCNFGAMVPVWDSSTSVLSEKIAEYALAVVKGKKHFHISFINNISPLCDCWNINHIPIAPDIGIAMSLDPVALDQVCVDLVIKEVGHDPFKDYHPETDWSCQLDHAQSIGLGTREYELVKISCI